MGLIGLLLLAGTAVAAGGLLYDGRHYSGDAHIFGQTITGISQSGYLAIGIGLGMLAALSVGLMMRTARVSRARRKERELEVARLEKQRDALAHELQATRAADAQATTDTDATPVGATRSRRAHRLSKTTDTKVAH